MKVGVALLWFCLASRQVFPFSPSLPSLLLLGKKTRGCGSNSVSLDEAQLQNRQEEEDEKSHETLFLGDSRAVEVTAQETAVVAGSWVSRAQELLVYAKKHGHCLVPKRYPENPALGNWVNKQRQQYRKYLCGEKPCSLTAERIEILNAMGFCWDATHMEARSSSLSRQGQQQNRKQQQDEDTWWEKLKQVKSYMAEHSIRHVHDIPAKSRLDDWIREQRRCFQQDELEKSKGIEIYKQIGGPKPVDDQRGTGLLEHSSCSLLLLNQAQRDALNQLDPHWHLSSRQAQWERRFAELVQFKEKYGHVSVPISFSDNKPLANWVSTQRKQYNLLRQGKPSDLTEERLARLESIRFVWNRWDHDFAVRQPQQRNCLD